MKPTIFDMPRPYKKYLANLFIKYETEPLNLTTPSELEIIILDEISIHEGLGYDMSSVYKCWELNRNAKVMNEYKKRFK